MTGLTKIWRQHSDDLRAQHLDICADEADKLAATWLAEAKIARTEARLSAKTFGDLNCDARRYRLLARTLEGCAKALSGE